MVEVKPQCFVNVAIYTAQYYLILILAKRKVLLQLKHSRNQMLKKVALFPIFCQVWVKNIFIAGNYTDMPFRDFSKIIDDKFRNHRLAFFGYGQKQSIADFLRMLGEKNENVEVDIALAVEGYLEGLTLLGSKDSIKMDYFSQFLSCTVGNFLTKKPLVSIPESFRAVVYNTSHHKLIRLNKNLKLVKTKEADQKSEFHPFFASICKSVVDLVELIQFKKNELFESSKTRFEVYLHLANGNDISWRQSIENAQLNLLEEMKTFRYMACNTSDLLEMIYLLGNVILNIFSKIQTCSLSFSILHFAMCLFEKF